MEISNKLPPVYTKQNIESVEKTAEASPRQSSAPAVGDRVELSANARRIQAAREAIRMLPEIDMEKVNRIKNEIKNGTYPVDSQKAASKMLAESLLTKS